MNYNAENRTPRDRIGEELFSQIGDMPAQKYGMQKAAPSPAATSAAAMYRSGMQTSCPINRSGVSVDTGAPRRKGAYTSYGSTGRTSDCSCSKTSNGKRTAEKCRMHGEDKLAGLPLAMAYVPMQEWRNLYDLEDGFDRGTLFRELDFPFYPTACPRKGCR